ncbi:MAG: hypothetical protein HYS06_02215 [Methylocystis sp.]|nr:hypothetical protein [Methylocystis sp.]
MANVNRKNMPLQGLRIGRAATWFSSIAGPLLAKRGVVTYTALSEQISKFTERRAETRRQVYLQSGKVLNHKDQFLTECLFKNRTRGGIHLKLAGGVVLPKLVQLYDDRQSTLTAARVMWQRGKHAGCRVISAPLASNGKLITRLRGRYYAVR